MNAHSSALLRSAVGFGLLLLGISSAHATGLFRTYLSINGLDTNPCTLTAPCRLLPKALTATQDGGEVWMLDSANYNSGTVTIAQSVTILAVPGALGSVVANGGDAIDVFNDSITVTLRNLLIRNLSGTTNTGLYTPFQNTALIVENCEFSGLEFGANVSADGTQTRILNSIFRGNATAIQIQGATALGAKGTVEHTSVIGNGTSNGIRADNADVVISHSSTVNNLYGVFAFNTSTITLEENVIAHNTYGAGSVAASTVYSTGNNTFKSNGTDTTLPLTTLSHQ